MLESKSNFFLIRYFKPRSILEIGTHVGASTINIASAINYNNEELKRKTNFHTVDIRDVNSNLEKPWLNYGMTKSPLEMTKELNLSELVNFITADSIDYLEKTQSTFDFVFLDGGHCRNCLSRNSKALKNLIKMELFCCMIIFQMANLFGQISMF